MSAAGVAAAVAADHVDRWQSPVAGALWLRTWRLGEWLDGPVSPLFETFLLPLLAQARETGGSARFGWRMPRMFRMRRPAYCVLAGYYFARAEPARLSVAMLPARFLGCELRGGWLDDFRQRSLPRYEERLAATVAALAAGHGRATLAALWELGEDVAELWYALGLATGGAIPLQKFLCRSSGGTLDEADAIALTGGVETPATAEQESLWDLSRSLASSAELRQWLDEIPLAEVLADDDLSADRAAWRDEIARHLARFGHQVRSLDFLAPCLVEEPARLGSALRCYLEPGARDPRQARRHAAATREALCHRAVAGMKPGKRRLFERLMARAQGYAEAREQIVFQLQRAWPLFRRGLLALGGELLSRRQLANPADVFFLTWSELASAVEGGDGVHPEKAKERRRVWHQRQALDPPVSIPPGSDPVWRGATTWPINLRFDSLLGASGARVLQGTGASPGRARGRARVLWFASEGDRLAAGDVLVAVATTPDWTPLFALAGAIVTDVGGTASHSSIVAREYGIPAVVGTRDGTRQIRDGELLTVDGSGGRVYLGAAAEETPP